MKNNKDSIIKGALVLTIAGLITRVLGFLYRIYMSNLIGSEGMGVFQLIFPIYMICYTVCCSGLFTAISKLIAEQKGKKNIRNMTRIINCATTISIILSIILSIAIYLNINFISNNLLHEPRTNLSLKLLAAYLPFMAISSSVKGYFYGLKKTVVPAIAQVVEQILRIIIVYAIANMFIPRGLEYACGAAVIGMAVGEIISCFYVIISYKMSISKNKGDKNCNFPRYRTILKRISDIAIPLTINRVLITILSSVETILIPLKLKAYGLNHSDALSVYGILTGMALPLILFPSVFTNSLSLMLLPTVSEAQSSNNYKSISYTTTKTLQYSLLIGIGSTSIFLIFGNSLGYNIYHDRSVGPLLMTLSWLCPFLYLNTTIASILNGLGYQLVTLKNNSIGLIIRIIFTLFAVPYFGLKGYLWGLLISFLIVSVLDIMKVLKITKINFDVSKWLLKPILAAISMSSVVYFIYYNYILKISTSLITLLITCCILSLAYFIALLLLDCIPRKDLGIIKRGI